MILLWQFFRHNLFGLGLWIVLTGLLHAMIGHSAGSVAVTGMEAMLERLPESMRNLMGYIPGLAPVDAFVALELGTWGSMLLSIYAVLLALGAITREVDSRTIDFLLAQPVERHQVLLARIGVIVLNTALLAAAMWTTLWASLTAAGVEASFGRLALLYGNQWLLALAWAGLVLLTSLRIDDYNLGVKLWLGLLATSFLLEFVLRAVGVARWARFYSPFSYVDAGLVVRDGLPAADVAVLLSVAVLTFALSVPAFAKKQITV